MYWCTWKLGYNLGMGFENNLAGELWYKRLLSSYVPMFFLFTDYFLSVVNCGKQLWTSIKNVYLKTTLSI
jgi:hypothetical protein